MRNKPVLMERKKLDNGLTLELFDLSRRVAGDRWLVGILARIPLEITMDDFSHAPDGQSLFERFVESEGRTIYFEIKKERNFIDENERKGVLNDLLQDFRLNTLPYLGHESLASGIKKKRIAQFQERQRWWK